MALGPGKYDDLASYCIQKAKAQAVVVIVFGGSRGSGMSGKELRREPVADFDVALRSPAVQKLLPKVLRAVAESIEQAPLDSFLASDD